MGSCFRQLAIAIITVQLFDFCATDGVTLKVQMLRYYNEAGKDWNGRSCDYIFKTKCDNRFTFCLQSIARSPPCDLKKEETEHVKYYDNDHDITFDEHSGGTRILEIRLPKWPGSVRFKTEVHDDDGDRHSKHDLIDKFDYLLRATPDKGPDVKPKWHGVTLVGLRTNVRPTTLQIRWQVYCDNNYYTDHCDVHCVARDDSGGHYKCDQHDGSKICLPDWEGKNCDILIDNCKKNPCKNNGTCLDGDGAYTCKCQPDYTGLLCQHKIDDCVAVTCQHGGTCVDDVNSYHCACAHPYSGDHCEMDLCSVSPLSCQNNGVCVMTSNQTVACACPHPYRGSNCELIANDDNDEKQHDSFVGLARNTTTTSSTTSTTLITSTTTTSSVPGVHERVQRVQTSDNMLPIWTILLIVIIILLIALIAAVFSIVMVRRARRKQTTATSTDMPSADPNAMSTFTNPVYSHPAGDSPQATPPSAVAAQVSPVGPPPYVEGDSPIKTPRAVFFSQAARPPSGYDYPPPPRQSSDITTEANANPVYELPPWSHDGTHGGATAQLTNAPALPPKMPRK